MKLQKNNTIVNNLEFRINIKLIILLLFIILISGNVNGQTKIISVTSTQLTDANTLKTKPFFKQVVLVVSESKLLYKSGEYTTTFDLISEYYDTKEKVYIIKFINTKDDFLKLNYSEGTGVIRTVNSILKFKINTIEYTK